MRAGGFTAREAAALTGINYHILRRDIKKGRLRVPARRWQKAPFRIRPEELLLYYDFRRVWHKGGMSINPDAEAVFCAIQLAVYGPIIAAHPRIFGGQLSDL